VTIPPPLFGIQFKKEKKLFYFSMEAYMCCPVGQGYKDICIRVCFETIMTFFSLLHRLEEMERKDTKTRNLTLSGKSGLYNATKTLAFASYFCKMRVKIMH
jgi:hypothetical protein